MKCQIQECLTALVLVAGCASAPVEPVKEPEVLFLDVFDAVPYFRQKYGCVGMAIAGDEPSSDLPSSSREIFQEMARRGIPLSEAAIENYKKNCSPDTQGVTATAYFGRYALAWRE